MIDNQNTHFHLLIKEIPYYYKCFKRYADKFVDYGNDYKTFSYDFMTNNCCHFSEDVMQCCGLTPCFTLSKRTALMHIDGIFGEETED